MTAHSETKKKTQQQQLKNAYSARIFNIMVISIHSKVNQQMREKKKKYSADRNYIQSFHVQINSL